MKTTENYIRLLLVASLLILLSAPVKADPPRPGDVLTPEQAACGGNRISHGCEKAGVHLDRLYSTFPEEYAWLQAIRLRNNGYADWLHSLAELKGLVQIKDGRTALRYVRLLTSPMTWNLIGGREMEIVTPDQAAHLPTFGLKDNAVSMDPDANFDPSDLKLPPGLGGVIPPHAYHLEGFTPAEVKPIPGGFVISRWLFTNEINKKREAIVERIREIVGSDGGYSRTVMARKRVEVPGVVLRLPNYSGE